MRINLLVWLWKTLGRFAETWMRQDAIRVSASDSLWLKLQPPCVTLWQGERVEVLSRRDFQTENGPAVQFECRTSRGLATLLLHSGRLHRPPSLEWRPNNDSEGEESKRTSPR